MPEDLPHALSLPASNAEAIAYVLTLQQWKETDSDSFQSPQGQAVTGDPVTEIWLPSIEDVPLLTATARGADVVDDVTIYSFDSAGNYYKKIGTDWDTPDPQGRHILHRDSVLGLRILSSDMFPKDLALIREFLEKMEQRWQVVKARYTSNGSFRTRLP